MAHIGYHDNTTAPVSMAAADPIQLASSLFFPGLHPTPPTVSLRAGRRGRGKQEGVLRVTLGHEGRPESRLAGGTVGGRGAVSGREEWRIGTRKREVGWG